MHSQNLLATRSRTALLCLSLFLPAGALEVTIPAGCDAFPAPSANLCSQEMVRDGRFEFRRITCFRDCTHLASPSAIGECQQSQKNHDLYFVSVAPRPSIVYVKKTPEATAPTDSSARSTAALEPGYVAPLSLYECNTEALEAIASYTKM